jgi:acetyl esterase/lipase
MKIPKLAPDGSFPLWRDGTPEPDGVHVKTPPVLFPFLPKSAAPTGAVIVCPGGGYSILAPHEGAPIAEMFNRAGIAAFVLHYRLAPHRFPASLHDLQRAIRLVRLHAKDWKIKPDCIAVLGFSAGGHLASTAVTHFDGGNAQTPDPVGRINCRPDAGILCYPVISFGPCGHHGSMVNLIGENSPESLRMSLSNELQVTRETPPCFLWHTANDECVPVEHSLQFATALSRCKVPYALHVFPNGPHGMGLATDDPVVSAWSGLCVRWLKTLGF